MTSVHTIHKAVPTRFGTSPLGNNCIGTVFIYKATSSRAAWGAGVLNQRLQAGAVRIGPRIVRP